MHFTSIAASLAAMTVLSKASPAGKATVSARATTEFVNPIPRIPEEANCGNMMDWGFAQEWGVAIPWDPAVDASPEGECGKVYLERLRDNAGAITDWECVCYDEAGALIGSDDADQRVVALGMKFAVNGFVAPKQINNAIREASNQKLIPETCDGGDPIVLVLP